MNTPAHIVFGAAFFGRPDAGRITAAAMLGGVLPDVSLYGMVGWHLLVLETSPEVVFGQLYFSDDWMRVFAVDNSFILWGLLLALAVWRRSAWAIALTGAALLHLATDFPLHAGDGRPQFWPLTMWIYDSPMSYWDGDHGAGWIGPLEWAATMGLGIWIITRFRALWVRGITGVMMVLETLSSGIWRVFF